MPYHQRKVDKAKTLGQKQYVDAIRKNDKGHSHCQDTVYCGLLQNAEQVPGFDKRAARQGAKTATSTRKIKSKPKSFKMPFESVFIMVSLSKLCSVSHNPFLRKIGTHQRRRLPALPP